MEPFQIGDVVAGKYEITRVLGQGGMGVVVAARHRELGELVALKFLRPTSSDRPESAVRFAREARTASRIKNEHVARVYDVGTVDGVPFIVMEHLVGEDLARVIKRRGPLPGAEAVDLLLQACEAIAEAHNLGIVHRDLKPANLFVTTASDGTPFVKVLDFGISKSTSAVDASVTATAALLGSPLYMSPEQLASSRAVDARADVWSLGVILYELLAGRTPFAGETFATLAAAILRGTYAPLSELRPDVPAPLEEAIAAALARESAGRPTVAAFAARIAPSGSEAARASCQRIERIAARLPPAPAPGEEDASGATVPAGPPSEVARVMAAPGEVTQPPALERSVVAPARRPLSRVVKLALAVGAAGLVGGAAVVGVQQASSVPLAASDPGAVGHPPVALVDDAGAPDADDAAATSPASAGDGGVRAIQVTDGLNALGDFAVATWPDREHPGGVIDALTYAPHGTDGAIMLSAIDLESRRIIARNPLGNYAAESIVKIARTPRGVVVAHQRESGLQLDWYTDGTIDADQHSLPQLAAKSAGRLRAFTVLDDRLVVATGGEATTTVWILDDKGTLKTGHVCHGGVYSEGDVELVRMGDDVIVSNFTIEEPDRVPVCAGRLHGAPRWREVILRNGEIEVHAGRVYFSRSGGADHAAVHALDENLEPTGLPPPPAHAPVGRTPCEGVTGVVRHAEEVGERAVISTIACCGDTGAGLFVCGPPKQGG